MAGDAAGKQQQQANETAEQHAEQQAKKDAVEAEHGSQEHGKFDIAKAESPVAKEPAANPVDDVENEAANGRSCQCQPNAVIVNQKAAEQDNGRSWVRHLVKNELMLQINDDDENKNGDVESVERQREPVLGVGGEKGEKNGRCCQRQPVAAAAGRVEIGKKRPYQSGLQPIVGQKIGQPVDANTKQ